MIDYNAITMQERVAIKKTGKYAIITFITFYFLKCNTEQSQLEAYRSSELANGEEEEAHGKRKQLGHVELFPTYTKKEIASFPSNCKLMKYNNKTNSYMEQRTIKLQKALEDFQTIQLKTKEAEVAMPDSSLSAIEKKSTTDDRQPYTIDTIDEGSKNWDSSSLSSETDRVHPLTPFRRESLDSPSTEAKRWQEQLEEKKDMLPDDDTLGKKQSKRPPASTIWLPITGSIKRDIGSLFLLLALIGIGKYILFNGEKEDTRMKSEEEEQIEEEKSAT